MARCEDWPCCGHEAGCCPDFNEAGEQLNMRCVCGAEVPLTSKYSLCVACLHRNAQADDEVTSSYADREYDYEESYSDRLEWEKYHERWDGTNEEGD